MNRILVPGNKQVVKSVLDNILNHVQAEYVGTTKFTQWDPR